MDKSNVNIFSFWKNVIENETGTRFQLLLIKTISKFIFKGQIDTIVGNDVLRLLKTVCSSKTGIEKEDTFEFKQNSKRIVNLDNGITKQKILCLDDYFIDEKYYSFMGDERNFIKDNNLKSSILKEFIFIKEIEFKPTAPFNEIYKFFNVCLNKFENEENFIRLYYNSPLKLVVGFEYLLEILKNHFNCKNKRIKFLLKDYLVKGKISGITENYYLITPLNLNTKNICRISRNEQLSYNEKQEGLLKENKVLYFRFDYAKIVKSKTIIFLQSN